VPKSSIAPTITARMPRISVNHHGRTGAELAFESELESVVDDMCISLNAVGLFFTAFK